VPDPNIIATKVQAVHGGVSLQTGFLPPNVMFASNFERKHLYRPNTLTMTPARALLVSFSSATP
jgi:hypothetical protein